MLLVRLVLSEVPTTVEDMPPLVPDPGGPTGQATRQDSSAAMPCPPSEFRSRTGREANGVM